MPSTSNKRNKALNRLKAFASPWVATNRPFVMSMSQRPTCWECRKSCIGGEALMEGIQEVLKKKIILYGSEAWSLRMIQWRHIGWVNIRTLYPSLLFLIFLGRNMRCWWINESKTLQAEAGSEALAGLGDLKDFVGGVFLGLEKNSWID